MVPPTLRRLLLRANPNHYKPLFSSLLLVRPATSTSAAIQPDELRPKARSSTPLQKQFRSCIETLPPDFTPRDLSAALVALPDPDLAIDLFRWASLRPHFRHNSHSYHTILHIAISARRFHHAETLLDEILAGACPDVPSLPLLNSIIRFCCRRRHLSRAFDVLNLMTRLRRTPTLETYSTLLAALLRRFRRGQTCLAYMHSVRSLVRRMKASGIVLDTFAANLVIKAHSICLEMDEAVRVFDEMRLYKCEPDGFTYGYIVKGMCEKGRIGAGMRFFEEMRGKGLVPTGGVYMVLVNSLSMERRFGEAVEVARDMIGNGKTPDAITYRTLLEGLCREGRDREAKELLEEVRRKRAVNERTYFDLLDGIRWLCPEFNTTGEGA